METGFPFIHFTRHIQRNNTTKLSLGLDILFGHYSLGQLMEAIIRDFGSFDKMKEELNAASVGVQGSGWGWLVSGE